MVGERANALWHQRMTLQGGAPLPQTPLLSMKRIFNSGLPVRASGSAGPSLLHDLVEVRVDPAVSP